MTNDQKLKQARLKLKKIPLKRMYNKQESPKLNKFDNKQYVLVNKQGEKVQNLKRIWCYILLQNPDSFQ